MLIKWFFIPGNKTSLYLYEKGGVNELENLIETKVNIVEYINRLNISGDNKHSLKYWVGRKQQGQECDDIIYGMCLALQNEKKITPEDFIIIVMWESKVKEEAKWKSFLRSIRFWR